LGILAPDGRWPPFFSTTSMSSVTAWSGLLVESYSTARPTTTLHQLRGRYAQFFFCLIFKYFSLFFPVWWVCHLAVVKVPNPRGISPFRDIFTPSFFCFFLVLLVFSVSFFGGKALRVLKRQAPSVGIPINRVTEV